MQCPAAPPEQCPPLIKGKCARNCLLIPPESCTGISFGIVKNAVRLSEDQIVTIHSPFGTVKVTCVCPFQMLFEHGQTPLYSGICMKNPCKYTSNVETVNSNLTGHIPAIQCHTVFEQFRKTVYDRDGKKGIWTLFFYHWHFTVPVERPAADGRAVPAGQT